MKLVRDPGCTLCRLHADANTVCLLGQGPVPCDVMIIGEAPGRQEDEEGKAFIGKSGQFLEETLAAVGIDRRDVFISNAVHCRPLSNRTPTKGEIAKCKHWLDYELKHVKPKVVLLLGNTPLQSITGKPGIKARRGRPFVQDGITFVPTYHPAAIGYAAELRPIFENDIKLFSEVAASGEVPRETKLDYVIVDTWKLVDEMIKAMTGAISYDIETTCLYPWAKHDPELKDGPDNVDAKINTMGWGTRKRQYILPVAHPESVWSGDDLEIILDRVDERMHECFVIAQFGKFDSLWTWVHYNRRWRIDFDCGMASYILDENSRNGLKENAQRYCNAPNWDVDKDVKTVGPLSTIALYHAHDLYYTRDLRFIFGKMLDKDWRIKKVFDYILMPCVNLFTEIEYDGVCIDTSKMADAEKFLRKELAEAKVQLEKFGKVDNWGSTKQLAHLLFDKLGIKPPVKTAKGNPSTSESALNQIDHLIGGPLIRFRGAKQALSFFIEGWKPFLVKKNNDYFLHPQFKLHGTVAGRPSCESPNLQQTPQDPRIRSLIKAATGWVLVEVDLSQIELRIIAEVANEPTMIEVFATGKDIHWMTALREIERGAALKELVMDTAHTYTQNKRLTYSECIEELLEMGPDAAVEINKEWKLIRNKAKAINFGYCYGMWWKRFKTYARDNYGVHVSDQQAKESREFFFAEYRLEDWHRRQKKYARYNGYVQTLSYRKRRLPAAQRYEDTPERREAERQAINAPIQGFASDINLMCALQLREEFGRDKVRICGTVHDNILFWCRPKHVKTVVPRILKIMQRPRLFDEFEIDFRVPICGEAKIGPWSLGVSLKKWLADEKK